MNATQNQDKKSTAKTYGAGELMRMSHEDKIEIIQSLQSERDALASEALAAVREAKTIQVLTDEEYDKAISGRKRERREVVRVEKLQIKAAVRGESEGGK